MAEEESLPDLSELLGYDFEDDEPDLSKTPYKRTTPAPKSLDPEEEEESLPPLVFDDAPPASGARQASSYPSVKAKAEDTDEDDDLTLLLQDEDDDDDLSALLEHDETPSPRKPLHEDEDLAALLMEDDDNEEDEEEPEEEDEDTDDGGNAFYYHEPRPEDPEDDDEELVDYEKEAVLASLKKPKEDKKASQEDDDEEEKKPKKEKKPKEKNGKSWWQNFKAQAAAELQGKDAPDAEEESSHGKELALVDHDASDDQEEDDEPKKSKRGATAAKSANPLKRLLAMVRNLYLTLVNFIFKLLDGVLAVLSKIPLVGRLFKRLREFTKVLKAIATCIPLVLLICLLVFLNLHAVPSETKASLPDEGGATFTSFKYDPSTGRATGVVKNTGDVIAEVTPTFSIYTMQPSLNPLTWFMPQKQVECRGELVRVDIDHEAKVTATCPKSVPGFLPRASGVVK